MTAAQSSRRLSIAAAALTAAAFAVVAWLVTVRYPPLMSFDGGTVDAWNGAVSGTPWQSFFASVAAVSAPWVVRILLLGFAVAYAARRAWRTAIWIVSVLAVNGLIWGSVKATVHRPRPDVPHQVGGWSFPSGHASDIAVGMGILLVLTLTSIRGRRLRAALVVAELAAVVLIGSDRIFLGAHYPSDVVGGWLVGATVVLAAFAAFPPFTIRLTSAVTAGAGTDSAMPGRPRTLGVVLNPIKVSNPDDFKARVSRSARVAGWNEPLWFETTVDDAGSAMARAAVAAGADVVAAAGGDGTVRVVCGEMAGSGVPVGVIPSGTGNLLARNLGIPLLPEQAVETLLTGRDRAIDVVRLEGDGLPVTRFVVMAGMGLDAAIMDGAPDALKKRLGWPAYLVAGAKHLRYPAVRIDISVDGAAPVRRRARSVLIGNVGSLQAGIPLLPDARIDDGVLDVVVIAPGRLVGWVSLAWRVITRHRRIDEQLDRYTGRSVVLKAASTSPRQLDGDTVEPGTELRAWIEPGVLLIRVPH